MNTLNNIKIGTKLIGSFLFMALLLVGVAVIGYYNMGTINGNLTTMFFDNLHPIQYLGSATEYVYKLRGDQYKYMVIESDRATVAAAMQEDIMFVNQNMDLYRETQLSPEETAELKDFDTAWLLYQTEIMNVKESVDSGDMPSAIEQMKDGGKASNARKAVSAILENLTQINVTISDKLNSDSGIVFANSQATLLIISIITVLLALGLGFLLSNSITGPLQRGVYVMQEMSQGRLSNRINMDRKDEIGVLTRAMDQMSDRMREILSSISEAANNLGSATAEILAATTQQASGASEQSAAIAQTTTTVEEVKASAEQASMRAQDVATTSQRTIEVARGGQTSVQATIISMGTIKEQVEGISENLLALSDQTQQIGEIISTVNEIASQSNMLALNASVEAARAGEHGKGFAVVATEVRSLAEQSRQATEQIKAILSEIQKATNSTVMATEEGVKGVDRGVQLSSQSRESIEQLAAVINESAQVAAQVVASGQQQQAGIDQISLAMQNINQVTMQSLASTRQTEKSAQNLNELARKMNEILAAYSF
jgi:methyl-accepting chemotaxis protein